MSDNAFKNLINESVVEKIGKTFKDAHPSFDLKKFKKTSLELSPLELKARVLLITEALRRLMPGEYPQDYQIIKRVLAAKKLKGFELWPISEYISQFGTGHFKESLALMYVMTQDFTSEFAIRSFLLKEPKTILRLLEEWIEDENVHIRRWISEGTRPILPWGGKIPSFITEPATLHLLEKLKYDEELYVRKSVANHLNDITKNHPKLVVKTLKRWVLEAPEEHKAKIDWIKRHALRTLIKKGDADALSVMGVSEKTEVKVKELKLNQQKFKLGDSVMLEFEICSTSKKAQTLIVDYIIGFRKANGSLVGKVFKLRKVELGAGKIIKFKKSHSLKKITTYYPGQHDLAIQVNGKVLARVDWKFFQ